MVEQLTLSGMVISAMPIGEYDKRVVILTAKRGRITAFARGARRPSSTMVASTEPFVFGEFSLIEGRSSYTLTHVNVQNYFAGLREDLVKTCYGLYILEFASYYSRENIDETQTLKLLYQTLRVLGRDQISPKLIRRIFELKLLVLNGEYPQSFQCVHCHSEEGLNYFSAQRAGLVCENCRAQVRDTMQIRPTTVYTLQYIITSTIEKLYSFTVNDEVLQDLSRLMDQYLRFAMDRTLKSLEMLDVVDAD